MRKITTAILLMLAMPGVVQATDGHDHSGYNFSVFRNYTWMKGAPAAKVQATQQQGRAFLPGWSATTDKLTGDFRDMFGPAAPVPGATNLQKARALMAGKLAAMGVEAAEWQVTRDVAADHAAYVDFERVVDGHKVIFSSMGFRFTTDGRLQRVKMKNYGQVEPGMQPSVSAQDALNGNAINTGLTNTVISGKNIQQDWVWFPIPAKNGYIMHPAWEFHVTGIGMHEMPFDLVGYIDATNGELLYRANTVNETFETTVKANVHLSTPVAPTTEVMMNNMRVEFNGNTYHTDDTGFLQVNGASNLASVKYVLRGPWSTIRVGNSTPEFVQNNPPDINTYALPIQDTTTAEFRAASAFYHVNLIHNYMKGQWPTFSGMDNTPMTTNVDISGNTCNAFYNNGGYNINFYAPQNTCRAFSIVSDIVYHEYGHGISYRFYQDNGSFFQNGGLGEGNSDVWAMCINRDGIVGDGAYYNGGNIRSYTGAPKVFPQDLVGQVHADGEIIAGAWWDVAQNIGSVDTMAQLFTQTFYDLPNGPDGTEGDVYHEILISAILNDDDDNNLANGTPHFNQIVEAFARHGIYLLSGAEFEHTEVANQPANAAVTISGNLTVTNAAFFDELLMVYQNRYGSGTWDTVAMTNTTGTTYSAQIPGYPAGAIVDYYFVAQDITATSAYSLPDGYDPMASKLEMSIPYQYGVGLGGKRYDFNFDNDMPGWEFGVVTDNASAGVWEKGEPVGTAQGGLQIQPEIDHTTGTGSCAVTGNGASTIGGNDVDNGKTTMQTPLFDLPFHEPVIEYFRWYSNDRGSSTNLRDDFWKVEMRLPTSQFWVSVDNTKQSDQRWRRRIFRVTEYLPTISQVQLRFVAEDRVITNQTNNGQNIIEAAVDDFVIYEGSPVSVENMPEHIQAEIYPNPADNMVNINVPAGSKGSLQLYDVTGKVLIKTEIAEGNTQYTLNTADIAPGTYMVLVQTQYAVQNTKIVIAHK